MSTRSVDEIRVDLAANRAKLANATSEAVESMKPKNIARESVSQVKEFAKTEFETATSSFKDESGAWRTDRLLMIGGAVVGAVVFFMAVSSVANRRSLASQARRAIEK
ncbi:DUF3618 domain-containing protein [Tessaracoccus sp. MC1865]|uniref:DUF3618 domain-containing protein n=1 Tax=unclassified Tessaracoccus TaxID=2635419 RepID=UPI00096CBBB8|nr:MULTISPECIES: DUF3618 domain-containing protein [unclassified Tessaracoccus]MBB1484466.1 DUF3618 domain-containing protein [Tessaracoccus sp. MC1865]MBB1509340.1 DUF3618 domain-containing protein [Tessaracoccus sp. MC1756]MCG6567092.1 DUF3618 domain-containing protein [Tessaracoccus sp. ZS01]OMG57496.1 hypothetical protein BJN44_05550 [Tessaracoccus sp. ZS01]QTO38430.1 DUF3618 domain-containing protein [Tessaracoccus sp. MC1865]